MQPNATLLNYFFPCCSIQDKRMADLEPLEWQKQLCDTSFDWFALSYEFTDLAMTRKDTLNIIWLHLVACTSQFPCFSGCRCVGQLMNLALYENFHPLNLCSSSGTIIEILELCPYPKLRSAKDLRNSWSWRRCSDYEGEITLFFLEQNPPLFMLKILNPVFTAKMPPSQAQHNIWKCTQCRTSWDISSLYEIIPSLQCLTSWKNIACLSEQNVVINMTW